MRFEIVNPSFAQVVLLTLGALAVLMPLIVLAGEKPALADEKQVAQANAEASIPAVSPTADFTKVGISKANAIFILRQAREGENEN